MTKTFRLIHTLTFLLALILTLFLPPDCSAAEPRRIAILPIYNSSGHNVPRVEAYLQEELDKNLHIPLNSTLNIAEFVPAEEVESAIFSINHKKPNGTFLQLVAEKVKADIAVCLVINKAYEYLIPRFDETYLVSGLSLQLIVYDNKLLPATHRYKASGNYCDTFSPSGSLTTLAEDTAYKLFRQAQLKQTIFPLQKNQP